MQSLTSQMIDDVFPTKASGNLGRLCHQRSNGHLFGEDFITQKYLRRYPSSKRAKTWLGKMVHIQTENGVWREGGCGYTWPGKPDAWIVPFEQAVNEVAHCGPEKMAKFLRAGS
ncbi:hypothetical protein [Agrobacterium pusense]|uniref:hypothetical protein n=1 Tax=Agrobacterium pusense TaxID=648995 RepID=UPI00345F00BC